MQNELELQIQTNAKDTDVVLQKLISTLQKVDTTMNSVLSRMNGKNSTKNLENNIDNLTKKANKFSNAFDFTTAFNVAEKGFRGLFSLFEKSIDYSENANLFNVALDDLTEKGMQFQNTLNEAFGTNQSETLRFQGLFQAMAKSMGVANDYAYALSEGLTKIGFDLASLYNISDVSAMNKLRAGLAGQTEPLRTVGMDITENSLKPIIERLNMRDSEGELLTPRQLNYAEKMLLRYIAIVDQAKVAQGDFANTIESPANQLKILGMQAQEAGRAIGNLFVGALAKILPYANAVIMVIEEVAKAIAGVLGIEIGDYNSSVASVEDAWVSVDDTTSNIGSNLDDANKKAKKLQRTVMGFDEIHSISTPTESSSPSSGSGSGGLGSSINPALLEALGTYENGMEKVRMKANEIRDAIMEWLGFTYDAEEGLWKFNEGLTPIKVILGTIATIAGVKIVKAIKTLASAIGSTGLGKAIKWTLSPLTDMTKKIKTTANESLGLSTKWKTLSGVLQKVALGGVGVVGAFTSLIGMSSAMESVAENGWTLGNALGTVASGLGSVASGAMIGTSILPGVGTAIGAVVGGIAGLSTALNSYIAAEEAQKAYDRLFDGQGVSINYVKTSLDNALSSMIAHADEVIKLGDAYNQSMEKAMNARDTINSLHDELAANNYQATAEQMNTLNTAYDDWANNVIQTGEQRKNIIIQNIEKLQEEGRITKEEADKIITAEKEKQLAKESSVKAYTYAMKQLDEQIVSGKITQEEYNKQVDALKTKYDITGDSITDLDTTYRIWKDRLAEGINLKDTEALKQLVKELGTEYENSKTKLEESYQVTVDTTNDEIKELERKRAKYSETSEEYSNYTEQINLLKKSLDETANSYAEDMAELQGNYKGVLATIYTEIQTSGNNLKSDVKKVRDEVGETLGKIGKDVDMTGTGKEIFDSLLNDLVENENPFLGNLKSGFNKYGITASDAFYDAVKSKTSKRQEEIWGDFNKVGREGAVKGYTDAITGKDGTNSLNGAGQHFGKTSIDGAKTSLDINSPSKEFRTLGKLSIEGYILGINDKEKDVMETLETLLEKVKRKFKDTKLSFNVDTSVEGSFNSLLTKLQNFCDKWRTSINKLVANMKTTMNSVKIDKNGKVSYTSMPKFSVPKFSNGGFPEDGLFLANHKELVGKFANGKTAVANNEQIIEGIKAGVYSAVVDALQTVPQNSGVAEIIVRTDESTIVNTAIKGINRETTRTGQCPIKVM